MAHASPPRLAALCMTILLAEDNPDDVVLFKRLLEKVAPDLNIHVATDGAETIEYLDGAGKFADRSSFPLPTLILLDIRMPKLDGLEVLEWIRRHPQHNGLSVIMLTDSDCKDHFVRASQLNVNSYVNKRPFMGLPQAFRKLVDQCSPKPSS